MLAFSRWRTTWASQAVSDWMEEVAAAFGLYVASADCPLRDVE